MFSSRERSRRARSFRCAPRSSIDDDAMTGWTSGDDDSATLGNFKVFDFMCHPFC